MTTPGRIGPAFQRYQVKTRTMSENRTSAKPTPGLLQAPHRSSLDDEPQPVIGLSYRPLQPDGPSGAVLLATHQAQAPGLVPGPGPGLFLGTGIAG